MSLFLVLEVILSFSGFRIVGLLVSLIPQVRMLSSCRVAKGAMNWNEHLKIILLVEDTAQQVLDATGHSQ